MKTNKEKKTPISKDKKNKDVIDLHKINNGQLEGTGKERLID